MIFQLATCLIMVLVSSNGPAISVNHLRYLKPTLDGGCNVYQTYNPPVIHSDWSCAKVEEEIVWAIKRGCNKC